MAGKGKTSSRPGKTLFTFFLLASCFSSLGAQVYFKADESGFRFGNSYLERCFEQDGDSWRSGWLVNKLTGHTWRVNSAEFGIRFVYERLDYWAGQENPIEIGAGDCVFRRYRIEPQEGGTRKLVVSYLWKQRPPEWSYDTDRESPGLEIDVIYTLEEDKPYMRKQIRLTSPGGKFYFVEELAAEEISIGGARVLHQGFGQPVYTAEMFLGLEFPGSENRLRDGRIRLSHYPGVLLGKQPWESHTAVWGVAPWGRTRAAFLDYIRDIRVAPASPFLLYNTWYDMRTPERDRGIKAGTLDYEQCLERIRSFRENLVDHGIRLKSFVLDEGWDRYTPFWEINTRAFPGGFGKLKKALKDIGSGLGLWLGPIGGYGEGLRLRSEAGRRAGLEVSHKGYLDLAGARYNRVLTGRLLEYIKRYDVNYYKLDGILFGYGDTDHGITPGLFAREAQTEALTGILDTLHAARPDLFTNITVSSWLSPWWLMHTDCVWMSGKDYGWLRSLPSPSKRDLAISYRDKVCFENFRSLEHQFPMNSLMTVGVIKGEYQYLGDPDETVDKWTNNLVVNFSRGISMWELYISPQIISPEEWSSLRHTIRWAEANSSVLLANTTMVGGDPAERECYGYFHYSAPKMILTVRNPYIQPAVFRMKLDYEHGWLKPGKETYLPLTVYPYRAVEQPWLGYGDTIEVRLSGYETRVIELIRADGVDFPVARGARFDFAPDGLILYPGSGGEKVTVENHTADEFTVSGHPVPPGGKQEAALELTAAFGSLEVEDRRREEWNTGGPSGLSGEISLRLPEGTVNAEVAFLLELDDEIQGIEPVITDNGTAVTSRSESGEKNYWYWFVASIEPGVPHLIAYDFNHRNSRGATGSLSAWLIAHRKQEGHKLVISDRKEGLDKKNPLPSHSGISRGVECLFDRPVRF